MGQNLGWSVSITLLLLVPYLHKYEKNPIFYLEKLLLVVVIDRRTWTHNHVIVLKSGYGAKEKVSL